MVVMKHIICFISGTKAAALAGLHVCNQHVPDELAEHGRI